MMGEEARGREERRYRSCRRKEGFPQRAAEGRGTQPQQARGSMEPKGSGFHRDLLLEDQLPLSESP